MASLIRPMVITGGVVVLVCCFIKTPETLYDYFSYIGYAVSSVTVLFVIYERWAWRVIPWNRPPVLNAHYDGIIAYRENEETKTKKIDVYIEQSRFSVKVKTKTDINSSYSVAASIEKECGDYILYYTYITSPDAIVQNGNPIQYGACRMVLRENAYFVKGKYWTTSRTIGDVRWTKHYA